MRRYNFSRSRFVIDRLEFPAAPLIAKRPIASWHARPKTLILTAGFAVFISAAGCVTINGKSYSPRTRFVSELACQPRKSSEDLRVIVYDSSGRPIPGAKVRVVQEPAGGIDAGLADAQGGVVFSLGSDTWQVSVWFPGYYPGERSVQIETRQTCVLTFYLRFNDRFDPGLFFCGLEDREPMMRDAELLPPHVGLRKRV